MEKTSRFFVPFSIVKGDGADGGDQQMVAGIASSETVDSDGEIISFDAIKAALADYMKFANLREMHGMSAAGTVTKADPDDAERILHIEARVVDPTAWLKVKEGVYKGFSIGGKALEREGRTITKMKLSEISLVDRPANPDALIELYKAEDMGKAKEPDVTENSIRVRIKNPGSFQEGSFRTIDISKPQGIKAVIGRPKGKDSTEVQTYIFDKDKWTPAEAKKWAEEHETNKEAAVAPADIKKGMSTIGALAYHYDCLVYLEECLEEEAEEEGEAPELAEMLAGVITQLGAVIVAGAEHEAAEHEAEEAEEAANKLEKNMAKKGISHKELCEAMKAIHEAYGEKLATFKDDFDADHMHTKDEAEAHKAEVFSHPSMSVPEQKEEAKKATKDEAEADKDESKEEARKAVKSDLGKTLADIRKRLTPRDDNSASIAEVLGLMAERLNKMESALQAPKAAARVIEKAEDGREVAKADASDPKSLLKSIHKAGGYASL